MQIFWQWDTMQMIMLKQVFLIPNLFVLRIVIMNIFRGDINRLTRGTPSETTSSSNDAQIKSIVPRCKPMELVFSVFSTHP